jgi:hypothetical protein
VSSNQGQVSLAAGTAGGREAAQARAGVRAAGRPVLLVPAPSGSWPSSEATIVSTVRLVSRWAQTSPGCCGQEGRLMAGAGHVVVASRGELDAVNAATAAAAVTVARGRVIVVLRLLALTDGDAAVNT